MQEFSSRLKELLEQAEQTAGFYEVEISFCIRLQEGNESYFLRLISDSDSDSVRTSRQVCLGTVSSQDHWF